MPLRVQWLATNYGGQCGFSVDVGNDGSIEVSGSLGFFDPPSGSLDQLLAVAAASATPVRVRLWSGGSASSLLSVLSQGTLRLTWFTPGVTEAGAPTPGCHGPATCWTNGSPRLGDSRFQVVCSDAPPSLGGIAALGRGRRTVPFVYDGVNGWLDPNLPIFTNYVAADPAGTLRYPLPIPNHPGYLGFTLVAQYILFEPTGCMQAFGLSGSSAAQVVVQP